MTNRDAARLLVDRYGALVKAGRREFHVNAPDWQDRVMKEAADQLVAEQFVPVEVAKAAIPEALAFVRNGGRWPKDR